MVEMVSGLTGIVKDVVKELRELKQPEQVQRTVQTDGVKVNTLSSRNRQLSPNAESFRPRAYGTGSKEN
jgi:hypothetical protein